MQWILCKLLWAQINVDANHVQVQNTPTLKSESKHYTEHVIV